MSAAPGYAYSVASHSTRSEEGVPPCNCPCHVSNSPGARGWYCNECHASILCFTVPEKPRIEYSHEQAVADGKADPRPYMVPVADYYFVVKDGTLKDDLGEHFPTLEQAKARADALNRADVIASLDLDPAFETRRERLRDLGETFWVRYGEGHPEARWPKEPCRYAVEEYSERYGESFWTTYETLDEVPIRDAETIFDLDTGKMVAFELSVSFGEVVEVVEG